MRIDSPLMTNSDATGSFTGSFVGDGSGLTGLTTASYIEFTNVDGLTSFSSSIQGRVANLEDFSSSLDNTFATDADLNLVSSSVDSLNAATSSYALEANISGSFTSLSQSIASDIADIIGGTQIVTSASYALTSSYSDGFTASSIASTNISTEYIDFDLTPTAEPVEGRLVWNADEGTVDLGLDGATLQLGQEQYWYVRNNTAQEISNGTAVYATGTLGASGRLTVAPFIADGSIPAKFFLGITTTNIPVDSDGYVTTFGKVRSFDTSTFNSGSVLYVSSTSAGSLTPTEPTAPNLKLPVAFSLNSTNNGTIAVRITQGVRLDDGHDVDINSASDGDLLVRSASVWINTKDLTGPYNINGAVTASVFTGTFAGAISQSAQIASDISGSLGPNATLIRSLTATSISGSLGPNATLIRSLTAAGISGSFTSVSQSIASDINTKLNIADTGSFAKTNVNNNFSGEQTFNNITVNGTGSFAYIQSVTGSAKIIGDAFIILNNDTPTERYAGMAVYDSGSAGVTASLQFDGQNNDWFYQYSDDGGVTTDHGVVMFGPEYSTIGSPTYPTVNTILKGNGSHHVEDTNITDDGSTVKINSNTQITGSLGVSGTITGTLSGNASTATTASHALTALYSGLVGSPPTWNQSTTGNAATATTASFASAGPFLYVSNNLSDLNDAATARTNLGVDAAGTDNSTNVTLNTTAHNYLSITGQEITLGAIDISDDTNLAAGTGLTLTGDTIAIDSSVLTTADEGSGNGLDADTVDSLQASQFLRSDADDTATGTITVSGKDQSFIADYDVAGSTWSGRIISKNDTTGVASFLGNYNGFPGVFAHNSALNAWNSIFINTLSTTENGNANVYTGTLYVNGNTAWHAGNDGAGSGLDADTLDTLQASQFLRSDASDSTSGTLTIGGGLVIEGSAASGGTDYGYYENAGTNIILKGDSNGRSGIFFQSEKDGTNINHPSDFGFLQFHSYGYGGTTGEANALVLGVANDSTDIVVLQSPYNNGVKIGYRDATSGTGLTLQTVLHTGNYTSTLDGRYYTETESDSRFVNVTGDTMTGVLTIQSSNDNQLLVQGTDTWAGIGFDDSNSGTDYIWYNGVNQTFAIGGGGANVSGKKLHVDGGMSVGANSDSTSTPTNGLYVEGDVNINGGQLYLYNTSGGSWNDGLVLDDATGWCATVYRRSNTPKFFHGLRSGTDNFIWMSPEYNNTGTEFNSTGRTDAILEVDASGDDIEFYLPTYFGQNVGVGTNTPSARLEVYESGSTVFSVNGSQGQLFSIEDDLTGTIFTVADISGVPILEVEDTGVVTIDDTLQVYGDITAYYSSDERLKDNITLIENANEKVMQLRGVEFDWNENSKHEGHDVGVIAQDVEKVLPELVQDRKNGYKGVDYQKIVALLIESNKELIKQNQDLTSRLERLESKLD